MPVGFLSIALIPLYLFILGSSLTAETSLDSAASAVVAVTPGLVTMIVDKSALTADLEILPDHFAPAIIIQSYRIAVGKELGDKNITGDNKTPEGIYLANGIKSDAELPEKYGPSAITLNYPNHFDQVQGKTGFGIWLHGVIEDRRVEEANVTEGCVAFYNKDILQIKDWLTPDQSIVIITTDKSLVNKQEDIDSLRRRTNDWSQAWANREHEQYASFYSPEFRHAGQSYEQYVEYKKNVFRTYKKMEVKISDEKILTHPKYGLSLMNQDFNGDDRFVHNGRKMVYWTKDETGQWFITREVYQAKRFTYHQPSLSNASEPLVGERKNLMKVEASTNDQENNEKTTAL